MDSTTKQIEHEQTNTTVIEESSKHEIANETELINKIVDKLPLAKANPVKVKRLGVNVDMTKRQNENTLLSQYRTRRNTQFNDLTNQNQAKPSTMANNSDKRELFKAF